MAVHLLTKGNKRLSRSFSTAIKATRQLGIHSLLYYARYQLGLYSGYYRWKLSHPESKNPGSIRPILELPSRRALSETLGSNARILIEQADEIVEGKIRLFGGHPVPMQLAPPGKLLHWTTYEKAKQSIEVDDVKTIWEPARFGWAFTLGRAYVLTGDERYPQAFWEHSEAFLDANPAYLGPNWFSAQEAALRLFALIFAWQVFSSSHHSNENRRDRLRESIAVHAARIPLTLVYAKAQNNNHLLTEAAGLYTAGLALPEHPLASRWRNLGWHLFNQALQSQITSEGAYIQHSTNYHRLMLQTLLWVMSLSRSASPAPIVPTKSRDRAAAATRWLITILDPATGRVPNLGPNDGAYILPFSTCSFHDFRPVLQAAASTFLGLRPFPPGPIDEMSLWLRTEATADQGQETRSTTKRSKPAEPHILRNDAIGSWAYLRAARFTSRPGHADQLHFDLWWRGENIALDPGTYRYNARAPWDNSLARTDVHNTVSIHDKDQMTRAGRFLWLDWAQAHILEFQRGEEGSLESMTAQHDGYRRTGLLHRRKVTINDNGWQIHDDLLPSSKYSSSTPILRPRLHWLLPDWPWQIIEDGAQVGSTTSFTIGIKSTYGWIHLRVQAMQDYSLQASQTSPAIQLVRAGELLHGSGKVFPTWGWFSPTYDEKIPALSFSVTLNCHLPAHITSKWVFPPNNTDSVH